MEIFDHAMQMEKDGEAMYRGLAQRSDNPGTKNIFNMLADDEIKHYWVFEKMKKEENPEMADTQILASAKNIFTQLKEEGGLDYDVPEIELYKKAQELEKKSEYFYRQISEKTGDPHQKEMLLRVAKEEKKHYFLLENVIDLVSSPKTWLENAEFSHFDDF